MMDQESKRQLAEGIAAYNLFLDHVITERKHYAGQREEHPQMAVWGDIIERNHARTRPLREERGP